MHEKKRVALVVAHDEGLRGEVGGWLEGWGFEVMWCSGPGWPRYVCLGGQGVPCPLATASDLIVLDLWLESDVKGEGTGSVDLLSYYRDAGKPIVVLDHAAETPELFWDRGVAVLDWPPRRDALERAAYQLVAAPR